MRVLLGTLLSLALSLQSSYADESTGSAVKSRMKSAEVILLGTVVSIEHRVPGLVEPVSEHAPLWHVARVQVVKLLKNCGGVFDSASTLQEESNVVVKIYFPGSYDVAWVGYPKYAVGQMGLWILSVVKNDDLEFDPGVQTLIKVDPYPLIAKIRLDFHIEKGNTSFVNKLLDDLDDNVLQCP